MPDLRALIADGRAHVFDGAMGTMLYARGAFINVCYDELNLRQPELVADVHRAYVKAGAEIIETNTFGANPVKLAKVEGRVDSDTAPELDEALTALLNANCHRIVVNLNAVDFLSSAGLRALVKAYQGAQKAGGSVRLAAVPEAIQGILLTVGLNHMLRAFPTDMEAVSGL